MDCAEEITVLRREVGPIVGGADRLRFDLLNSTMTVDGTGKIALQTIIEAVAQTGLRAEPSTEATSQRPAGPAGWPRRTLLTIASGALRCALRESSTSSC